MTIGAVPDVSFVIETLHARVIHQSVTLQSLFIRLHVTQFNSGNEIRQYS